MFFVIAFFFTIAFYQFFKNNLIFTNNGFFLKIFSATVLYPILKTKFSVAKNVKRIVFFEK